MFVNRDPYARTELHRSSRVAVGSESCSWCGGLAARGRLLKYRVEFDGGRRVDLPGVFCSISCMRAYSE